MVSILLVLRFMTGAVTFFGAVIRMCGSLTVENTGDCEKWKKERLIRNFSGTIIDCPTIRDFIPVQTGHIT
jgi:hypothetical protein